MLIKTKLGRYFIVGLIFGMFFSCTRKESVDSKLDFSHENLFTYEGDQRKNLELNSIPIYTSELPAGSLANHESIDSDLRKDEYYTLQFFKVKYQLITNSKGVVSEGDVIDIKKEGVTFIYKTRVVANDITIRPNSVKQDGHYLVALCKNPKKCVPPSMKTLTAYKNAFTSNQCGKAADDKIKKDKCTRFKLPLFDATSAFQGISYPITIKDKMFTSGDHDFIYHAGKKPVGSFNLANTPSDDGIKTTDIFENAESEIAPAGTADVSERIPLEDISSTTDREGTGDSTGDASKREGTGDSTGDASKREGSGDSTGDASKREGSGDSTGDASKREGSGDSTGDAGSRERGDNIMDQINDIYEGGSDSNRGGSQGTQDAWKDLEETLGGIGEVGRDFDNGSSSPSGNDNTGWGNDNTGWGDGDIGNDPWGDEGWECFLPGTKIGIYDPKSKGYSEIAIENVVPGMYVYNPMLGKAYKVTELTQDISKSKIKFTFKNDKKGLSLALETTAVHPFIVKARDKDGKVIKDKKGNPIVIQKQAQQIRQDDFVLMLNVQVKGAAKKGSAPKVELAEFLWVKAKKATLVHYINKNDRSQQQQKQNKNLGAKEYKTYNVEIDMKDSINVGGPAHKYTCQEASGCTHYVVSGRVVTGDFAKQKELIKLLGKIAVSSAK